jgi:YD repeat-containing protein
VKTKTQLASTSILLLLLMMSSCSSKNEGGAKAEGEKLVDTMTIDYSEAVDSISSITVPESPGEKFFKFDYWRYIKGMMFELMPEHPAHIDVGKAQSITCLRNTDTDVNSAVPEYFFFTLDGSLKGWVAYSDGSYLISKYQYDNYSRLIAITQTDENKKVTRTVASFRYFNEACVYSIVSQSSGDSKIVENINSDILTYEYSSMLEGKYSSKIEVKTSGMQIDEVVSTVLLPAKSSVEINSYKNTSGRIVKMTKAYQAKDGPADIVMEKSYQYLDNGRLERFWIISSRDQNLNIEGTVNKWDSLGNWIEIALKDATGNIRIEAREIRYVN